MWISDKFFFLSIVGLLISLWNCEGRSVNISNTWTLPKEGFDVFYRFFRDKISWFEADAVCQFHHANLVTVDNPDQFDAARNFLKTLDVTYTTWIGLMRPQNSERFTWSNSKPLETTSGYWSESLPVIESPLCAVIDPLRDYRWHALRCGGPETASFLCEMNVPTWASECTVTGIPSLTTQYMGDSGSVELVRDCGGDEGIIHQICKGKQDRDRVLKGLICKNERNIHITEDNSILPQTLNETHKKSLHTINSIRSDNNEENDIKINPMAQQKETTSEPNAVQKVIEQFNLEELMQADEPNKLKTTTKKMKKSTKKAKEYEKKVKLIKAKNLKGKSKSISKEELMMGDEPIPDVKESIEPLPHIKKSFPQDIKISPTTYATILRTSTEIDETNSTSDPVKMDKIEESSAETIFPTIDSTTHANIILNDTKSFGHPMHVQQGHTTSNLNESIRYKEAGDGHFIPPMLLVKTHYTSPKTHIEESTSENPLNALTEETFHSTEIDSISEVSNSQSRPDVGLDTTITKLQDIEVTTNPITTDQHYVEVKFENTTTPSAISITKRSDTSPTTSDLQSSTINSDVTTQNLQTEKSSISKQKNKFSNEENFQPYRPNRKRNLMKPNGQSFLKMILG